MMVLLFVYIVFFWFVFRWEEVEKRFNLYFIFWFTGVFAACRLSLVAVSRGYSLICGTVLHCSGFFFCCRALALGEWSFSCCSSLTLEHRLSRFSIAYGTLPDQGLNPFPAKTDSTHWTTREVPGEECKLSLNWLCGIIRDVFV